MNYKRRNIFRIRYRRVSSKHRRSCKFCSKKTSNYSHCGKCRIFTCRKCWKLVNDACPSCALCVSVINDQKFVTLPVNPDSTMGDSNKLLKRVIGLKKGMRIDELKVSVIKT